MSNSTSVLDYMKYDVDGTPVVPDVVLSKHSGEKIGIIPYISGFTFKHNMNATDEISFDVYKELDGKQNPMWDNILDFRLVYIPDYKPDDGKYDPWFEIYVSIDEGDETIKHVTGDHLQET